MGQEFRYYQCGDYFIPDIQLNPYKHKVLGKYGRMRREYLQEQNPMLLNDLILRDQLFLHLWEIDETAHCRVRNKLYDLAAKERKDVPADIKEYLMENESILKIIRTAKESPNEKQIWAKVSQII